MALYKEYEKIPKKEKPQPHGSSKRHHMPLFELDVVNIPTVPSQPQLKCATASREENLDNPSGIPKGDFLEKSTA